MHRGSDPQEGTTLVECLVAVAIVGISFAAVLGGMRTSVLASDVNRKQANSTTSLRSYTEAVKRDPYVACATSYPGAGWSLPAGFSSDPVAVAYWNPATSAFDAACGVDSGLQRVTLAIRSTDGRIAARLQLAKRTP